MAGCGLAGFASIVVFLALNDPAVLKVTAGALLAVTTTPFFVEIFFFLAGLALVVYISHWRVRKEGDGWVYLIEEGPESGGTGSHDAILTTRPESEPKDTDLAMIEGLLDLRSWNEAGEAITRLAREQRESPRGLVARHRLACGLGQHARAADLEKRIDSLRQ